MGSVKTVRGHWYDYPQYYDMAFRDETKREADFIEAVCWRYLKGVRRGAQRVGTKNDSTGGVSDSRRLRLLEPACGSGRLVVELSKRGHEVVAFDLSEKAVAYVRRKLSQRSLDAEVFCADMSAFGVDGKFDAAFNLVSSFRHLVDHDDAAAHLSCVAKSLRVGGLYILGLIVVPEDSEPSEGFERWSTQQGQTRLTVSLRVTEMHMRERWERMETSLTVRRPAKGKRNGENRIETMRIVSEETMGLYTPEDMLRLLRGAKEFEILDTFDFWYEIDRPEPLGERFGDVVYVLRKRGQRRR